ncbi:MAG TPA: 4-hydroxy-tetrahydrodipicolinate reductase [Acidimicrobiales bacterium]|nr:4-hydroxy-tetrahydrodipicolinate reductase [Acidimicrobiales bacterium]
MKILAIVGGAGRMGQALGEGLPATGRFSLAALVDEHQPRELFGSRWVTSLEDLGGDGIDAVVDFSSPEGVSHSAQWCARNAVALVVGATGLGEEQRQCLEDAATRVGVVVASNFSVGAVLAERFAAQAAPYFDRVEIIELHHDKKVDAPSGTSITTARTIAAARRSAGAEALVDPTSRHTIDGARGARGDDGVVIHSVRLPGLVAHQEVLFGSPGEGLTIRHDSFDRQSFVHGVALALDAVSTTPGLIEGISALLV